MNNFFFTAYFLLFLDFFLTDVFVFFWAFNTFVYLYSIPLTFFVSFRRFRVAEYLNSFPLAPFSLIVTVPLQAPFLFPRQYWVNALEAAATGFDAVYTPVCFFRPIFTALKDLLSADFFLLFFWVGFLPDCLLLFFVLLALLLPVLLDLLLEPVLLPDFLAPHFPCLSKVIRVIFLYFSPFFWRKKSLSPLQTCAIVPLLFFGACHNVVFFL